MRIRLVIHAPTPEALLRARSNARNLLADRPEAEVEIVTNAAGARAAVETEDPATDSLVVVCANSLARFGLVAPEGVRAVPAAVSHIAARQIEGWQYMRA